MKRNQKSGQGLGRGRAVVGWVILVAGLALPSGVAAGQNALGDGRNLEKQTGNAPLPPVRNRNESFRAQMKLNDAIVTGNATGGRSFRGNAGYTSANDFRGRLGSDDLFSFSRDAQPSWVDLGTNNKLRNQLDRQMSISRRGGNVDGLLGRGIGNQPFEGRARQTTVEQERAELGLGTGALRSTSAYQIGRALSPTQVGRVENNGQVRSTLASGLRGLTVTSDMTDLGFDKDTDKDKKKPSGRIDTSARSRTGYDELKARLDRLEFSTSARPEDQARTEPGLKTKPGEQTKPDGTNPTDGGKRPDGGVTPDGGLRTDPGQKTKSPLDPSAKATGDDSRAERAGTRLPGESIRERDPVTGLVSASAGGEAWRQRMAEIRKALNDAERAKNETKSKRNKDNKDENEQTPGGAVDRSRRDAAARLNGETIRAIRESGGTVDKFVTTLSPGGEERDVYAEVMALGQKYLADGRYFDAEERFVRAQVIRPDDATALVGRLHAQLGAGLVLSASTNLRALIREHPELIGVKYGPSLLPTAERLQSLDKDLDLTITPIFQERLDLRARREASLLKAYLGFQRNDRAMIANSLRMMEDTSKQIGEDESVLGTFLRGVWLGEAIEK